MASLKDTPRSKIRQLRSGDSFVVNGIEHVASTDAHPNGDSSYDGYIVYDEDNVGWLEEDFSE